MVKSANDAVYLPMSLKGEGSGWYACAFLVYAVLGVAAQPGLLECDVHSSVLTLEQVEGIVGRHPVKYC